MKITIESSTMTILVPANTNLGLIIAELKKIFPNGDWKKYNIQPELEFTYTYGNYTTYPMPNYVPTPLTPPYTINTNCQCTPNGICNCSNGTYTVSNGQGINTTTCK